MKLRVRGNSIRLRLNRGEVAALGAGGRVEERVPFGPGVALAYVFEAADVPALVAHFDGARIVVQAPRGEVAAWAAGDDVGIAATAPDQWLAALERLHGDRDDARAKGARGLAVVHREFSVEVNAARLEAIFRTVAAG